MFISVIIPTLNRASLLKRTLESLVSQTLEQMQFEVIVVDNGSSDHTCSVIEDFKAALLNLRYFYEPSPGLHVGRHIGFQQARGEILVYADDDIEAFPTWLQAIKESFENKEIVMVGGKCLPKFEAEPPGWLSAMWLPNVAGERILDSLSLIDLGDKAKLVNPYFILGCNFAIRRSVLLEAGGFHPDGMPQELIRFRGDGEYYVSKYVQTKGYKALYNPLASIYHCVPISRMTIEYFCRRAYHRGISDSYRSIRRTNGLDLEQYGWWIADLYRRFRNKSLAEILGAVWRRTNQALLLKGHIISGTKEKIDPYAHLHLTIAEAYRSGYVYHQEEVNNSPELLAWVLRPNYWDYQLPPLE